MRIPLASLGIKTLHGRDWPSGHTISYGSKNVLIPDVAQLHTTQAWVDSETVERKKREILAGTAPVPRVELFRGPDKRIWILDGHHTLVAYLQLGRIPKAAVYGSGNTPLPLPPRFRKDNP